MSQVTKKNIYPWVVVGLLSVVAFLNYLDRQMLATMQTAIGADIAELQLSQNFGRLMAIFLWIYAIVSPFAGSVADRLSRKWLIVGSLGVWSTVTLLMGLCTSFSQMYVLRGLMGISEALYIPSSLSLIADYHEGKNRSLAIGLHMTGLYLGQAVGGFGAIFSSALSWRWTFSGFGLVGIAYAFVLMAFLKEKRDSTDKPWNDEKKVGAPSSHGLSVGSEMEILKVAPDTVALGETIVIRPGDRVPMDGIVIEGSSLYNDVLAKIIRID